MASAHVVAQVAASALNAIGNPWNTIPGEIWSRIGRIICWIGVSSRSG